MPWKKILGKKGQENDNIVKTLTEIDEVKKKISLRERSLKTIGEKTSATECQNDGIIHSLREENQDLREQLSQVLIRDQSICDEIFAARSKSSTLAMRRKSVEQIAEDINETVCKNKRHLDKLKYLKKKREEKLASLQETQQFLEIEKMDDAKAKKQNLDFSLEKVKQQTIAARKILHIYKEVQKKLEKEVRWYPHKMDGLEKEKTLLNHEDFSIRNVHYNAMADLERVLLILEMQNFLQKEKKEVEEKIQLSKKEREQTLKELKQNIKEYDPFFEEQRKTSLQIQRKPKRPLLANKDDEKEESEKSGSGKVSPTKIAEYEDQANLLKSVTGIPFWNGKKMLWCLKNQMNIASDLKQQSKKKFEKARSLQEKKAMLTSQLDKIKYDDDRSFYNKVDEMKAQIKKNEDLISKRIRSITKKGEVADKAVLCSDLILSYLIRKTSNFRVAIVTPRGDTENETTSQEISRVSSTSRPDSKTLSEARIASNFEMLAEGFLALYSDAQKQLEEFGLTSEDVLEQPLISKQDQVKLLNDNNTRIITQLERKPSEEFDHYYANNEDYVSRDILKRSAAMAVRASRRR